MAQWKFTAKMGETKDKVAIGVGTPIAGSDAIELNVDATTMTRREFVAALKTLGERAIEANFPAA